MGALAALDAGDRVVATYRGHGWAIACGVPLERLMAEVCQRATGVNGGRGGSAHLMAPEFGLLGRELDRRGRHADRGRCRARRAGRGHRPGGGGEHRRRRHQPGRDPRGARPRRLPEAPAGRRVREQRLVRADPDRPDRPGGRPVGARRGARHPGGVTRRRQRPDRRTRRGGRGGRARSRGRGADLHRGPLPPALGPLQRRRRALPPGGRPRGRPGRGPGGGPEAPARRGRGGGGGAGRARARGGGRGRCRGARRPRPRPLRTPRWRPRPRERRPPPRPATRGSRPRSAT